MLTSDWMCLHWRLCFYWPNPGLYEASCPIVATGWNYNAMNSAFRTLSVLRRILRPSTINSQTEWSEERGRWVGGGKEKQLTVEMPFWVSESVLISPFLPSSPSLFVFFASFSLNSFFVLETIACVSSQFTTRKNFNFCWSLLIFSSLWNTSFCVYVEKKKVNQEWNS